MVQQNTTQFLKNLHRFRLVVFDVTDTLLRFRRPVSQQYKMTAAEMGITDIDAVQLQECFRHEFKSMSRSHPNFGSTTNMPWQIWWTQLVENVFAIVKPDVTTKRRADLTSQLVQFYRTKECWTAIEGSRELLEQVRATGVRMGVISNFDASLELVLREMELADRFDFILTSFEAGIQKPCRLIFEIARERNAVLPSEALHIGNDFELDYQGARHAGWSSLLVAKNVSQYRLAHPSHGYENLTDLLQALKTQDIEWQTHL